MKSAVLALGIALAGPIGAASAAQNPVVEAFGSGLAVDVIEVAIVDGLVPVNSDEQAVAYLAKRIPADQKARFETFVASRTMSNDLAGERLAEFFVIENLRDRLKAEASTQRHVRLSITIDDAKFPVSPKMPFVPSMPILKTRLGGAFQIRDIASGAVLAEGRIDNSLDSSADMLEARARNKVNYQNFGRDDHLQVLAGTGNALSRNLETLLRTNPLPTGMTVTDRMTVGAAIPVTIAQGFEHANFDVRVANPIPSQEH